MKRFLLIIAICLPIAETSFGQDKNPEPIELSNVSNVYRPRPRRVDANPERIRNLKVPPGFRIEIFATGTGNPRLMQVMPDGRVYVTRQK